MPLMKSKAQKQFDKLSGEKRHKLLNDVFELLEYDDEGEPGVSWNGGDICQGLGDLFEKYGVTFTPPGG